jgi:hypothetical protein
VSGNIDPATICKTLPQGSYVCDGCDLGTCSNGNYYKVPCAPGTHCVTTGSTAVCSLGACSL